MRTPTIVLGCIVFALIALSSQGILPPPDSSAAQQVPASFPDAARIYYSDDDAPVLRLADGENRHIYSMLNVNSQMKLGDYVWKDEGIADGETWILVDLSRQTLSVFRAGHEIGSTTILYGADSKPTPSGVFPILQKARTHRSNLYDAEMPFMQRLSWDGIAIHGSDVRAGQATHGCIGVPSGFAELLFDATRPGDVVSITAT